MITARAARAQVDLAIRRFLNNDANERLTLYRMHLQSSIRSISPLALALAKLSGVDLTNGPSMLRSPREWPSQSLADAKEVSQRPNRNCATLHYGQPRFARSWAMLHRYASAAGFVHLGSGTGMLLFDVEGDEVSLQTGIGGCALRVLSGAASLTLRIGLPETVMASMQGRRIYEIVDKPLFVGRRCVISRVSEAELEAGPTLVFETGRVRFTMPWPHLMKVGQVPLAPLEIVWRRHDS